MTRSKPYCLAWLGCGIIVLTTAPVSHAATTNLAAVADTSIHTFFPNNNFGGGATFTAGGRSSMNGGGFSRALLRFDIAAHLPAGATVNSAQLILAVSNVNGPDSTFDLHRLLAGWGEGGGDPGLGTTATTGEATWNHRVAPDTSWAAPGGDYQAASSGSQFVGAVGSYTFSGPGMASDVQIWLDNPVTNFGWALRSRSETTSSTIRRFAGRLDAVNPPRLVVDYSVPAALPPNTPNLFDLALLGGQLRFSFNTQSNRTYAVEYRDTLVTTNWSALTNIPALPADTMLHITNNAAGSERYFRARTP